MNTTALQTPQVAHESSVRDYFTLLKPGVMSLVVFSGFIGLWLAPTPMHPFEAFLTILCIAVGSGAGAAMNMWFDRDIDAIMLRTSRRPVPAGRITPDNALAFGCVLALFSVLVMGLATNWVAGGILAFAIFFYAVIYTMWLKRSTPQNIVIGGAAGAFPPVIGWAAATGDVSLFSLILFGIIFLWTPPHFWALALYRSGDYAKANVPMLPVVAGRKSTKRHIVAYSYALVAMSLLPFVFGLLGVIYTVCAALLGGYFILLAHVVAKTDSDTDAKRLFGYSILYLFLLLAAMPLDVMLATLK
jgi:protoheme IX farnesyltransferase